LCGKGSDTATIISQANSKNSPFAGGNKDDRAEEEFETRKGQKNQTSREFEIQADPIEAVISFEKNDGKCRRVLAPIETVTTPDMGEVSQKFFENLLFIISNLWIFIITAYCMSCHLWSVCCIFIASVLGLTIFTSTYFGIQVIQSTWPTFNSWLRGKVKFWMKLFNQNANWFSPDRLVFNGLKIGSKALLKVSNFKI
jgi:hypothetical protein